MILITKAKAAAVRPGTEDITEEDTDIIIRNAASGRTAIEILGKEKRLEDFITEQSSNIIVTHPDKIFGMGAAEVERIKSGILKNIMDIEILMGMTWYDDPLDRRIEDQRTMEIDL